MKPKVSLNPDKRTWHPSPLLGQIVLVTTLNEDGTSNVAPKSWISILTYGDEVILLGRVVAVSVDRAARAVENPYGYLRMPVYLEDSIYGVIEQTRRYDKE